MHPLSRTISFGGLIGLWDIPAGLFDCGLLHYGVLIHGKAVHGVSHLNAWRSGKALISGRELFLNNQSLTVASLRILFVCSNGRRENMIRYLILLYHTSGGGLLLQGGRLATRWRSLEGKIWKTLGLAQQTRAGWRKVLFADLAKRIAWRLGGNSRVLNFFYSCLTACFWWSFSFTQPLR